MSYYKEILLESESIEGFKHIGAEFSFEATSFDFSKLEQLASELSQETISLEGLSIGQIWKSIKTMFVKAKEYLLSFFKWFKEKVLGFFKSRNTARRVERLKTLIDTNTIAEKDFNKVLEDIRHRHQIKIIKTMGNFKDLKRYFKEKHKYLESSSNFPNLEIYAVISPEGKLFDLSKQYDSINEIKRNVLDPALKMDFRKVEAVDSSPLGTYLTEIELDANNFNYAAVLGTVLFNGWDSADVTGKKRLPSISLRYFYKALEDIDTLIADAENYAKRCETEISPDMRKLETRIRELERSDNADNRESVTLLNKVLGYCFYYIKLSTIPLRTATTYIRLLGEIDKRISGEAYITDTGLKFEHLYHLSTDGSLAEKGELVPVFPDTGSHEFLPKRTSFSETVEGCYFGTARHWGDKSLKVVDEETYEKEKYEPSNDLALKTSNGTFKRTMFLYEGFPDENTRFIKPKLVEATVADAILSKEICTTTPVKIKKVGLIEVEFKMTTVAGFMGSKHNHNEYGKFIGYRIISNE